MTITVSPTETEVFEALTGFLSSVLPPDTEVIQAQVNRVPEPVEDSFVIMTMTAKPRISTNIDTYSDSLFTGHIAGTLLTVTEVDFGVIDVGRPVFGVDVADGTQITARGTGTGGTGTYVVSPSQSVTSQQMAAGVVEIEQRGQYAIQLDFHGLAGGDASQVVSTLFRDAYATDRFPDSMSPLYCDDPRQLPFSNEQQQIENRWVVTIQLQVDQTVSVPQQFADTVSVVLKSVEVEFPPPSLDFSYPSNSQYLPSLS